jgi:hypothetical protein
VVRALTQSSSYLSLVTKVPAAFHIYAYGKNFAERSEQMT